MAATQQTRRAQASKEYQLVSVLGPSAGVDLRLSATELKPERSKNLNNWSLEEPGALVVRPGYLLLASQGSTANRVQGGARIYLNTAVPSAASTIFTLVGYNQSVSVVSDVGNWPAAVLSGLSTNELFFPSDRDMVVVLDGSTRGWKSTNGSSWTKFGLDAPSVSSTSSSKAGGGLSASEFEINYTYKDRDLAFESNGSTSPSTVTLGATGAIEVQVPNTTNAAVDAIVVYARNKTTSESVRRKVSSFAMQSTTAGSHSTVTITSSSWGTNDEEPIDHTVPSVFSFATVWKNRWWAKDATRTNRLWFSQLFQPQSWPALFYIDIPFDRGDEIKALIPLGDALCIFGATKIVLVIGQTSLDFEVRPTIASQDGALGPRAVCQLENGIVHAGAGGVWNFDGVSDRLLSYDILPAWQDLVRNAPADALARTACYYHQRRKELRVAVARRYPSGAPGEWILDLSRSQGDTTGWTSTDRDITGYIPWDGPEAAQGNRDRLFSWPSSGGFIFEESTGTSANSSNMVAQYEGPGLTLGAYRGTWIDLRVEYEPNDGSLTEQPVIDGVSMPSQSLNIGSGLSVYGMAQYGTATYAGAGRRQAYIPHPLAAEGRTLVQKFVYSGKAQFRLYGYHQGISPDVRPSALTE